MKLSQSLIFVSLLTTIFIFWSLKEIIILIFAGIILAMAICTIVGKVKSITKSPREVALVISLVGILLILSISIIIIVPQFTKEFQQLIIQLPSAAKALWEISVISISKVSEFIYGDNSINILQDGIFNENFDALPDGVTLANGITDSLKKLLNIAGNLGIGFVQIIFVIAISLMISIQPKSYREVIILLVPSFYRSRAREILLKCGNSLSSWMIGVIISSTFVALLAGICLYLLGIKLVIANALLAGMLNIIPNIGPTISTIFPMSVALLDTPWKSVAVLGAYILIQNIESYIITPSVMHRQIKMLPGLTLTAQFIFTVIFGPIGLLLSLPLAVIIQVIIKEILIDDILDKKNIFSDK